MFTIKDFLKATYSFSNWNIRTWLTSKLFRNVEVLWQEELNTTGTSNQGLFFIRKFIHTKDSNDILQFMVTLKNTFYFSSNCIVLFSNDFRCQCTWAWSKWVNGWVNTQLYQLTFQVSCWIQVSEGCCWRWVSIVIRWHIDSLDRGYRTFFSWCDTFLQLTHFRSKCWLVTNGWWHTTQKGRYFRTSLSETEDIIDKEKHVLAFHITEVFSDCQTSKGNTHTCSWWLIHLTKYHGCFLNNTWFFHFPVKVVPLTSTFPNTSKHWNTTVFLGNVVNQFLDQDGFTNSGTTEKSNLTTFKVRGKKVDNLNPCFKDFRRGRQFIKSWSFLMNWLTLCVFCERSFQVNGISQNIEDTSQSFFTYWYRDWTTCVQYFHSTSQTICWFHGDSTDHTISQLQGYFKDDFCFSFVIFVDDKCIVNLRKFFPCCKQNVYNGTDNLSNFTWTHLLLLFYIRYCRFLAQLGPNTLRKSNSNHVSSICNLKTVFWAACG